MAKTWDFAQEMVKWNPSCRNFFRAVDLRFARAYCAKVAQSHYENFSVVSFLLPRKLIAHFHAIYAYCRWSDDLADETSGGVETEKLIDSWRQELLACFHGNPRHPVMVSLRETILRFSIPPEPFLNLLVAFTQDQYVKNYLTFEQLLGYCKNSANPVGHLLLYLFECFDSKRAALADEVCTGLQLANFWQDIVRDHGIGRIYLPEEDRRKFGYLRAELATRKFTPAFHSMMSFEVDRTHGYFDRGQALLALLPAEVRVDVDLFIRGGRAILAAIERANYDVLTKRPEVTKGEKLKLLLSAILQRWF